MTPPVHHNENKTTKTDALTHLSSLIIFFIFLSFSCLTGILIARISERQALTVGPFVLDDTGSSSFGFEGVFFSSSLASKLSFSNSSLVLSLFSLLS